tara:strand:+ start:33306 stop:34319 length:1014 start_codon:yes stop_codon:yes gene_type:complete
MNFTALEIAEKLDGVVEGNGDVLLTSLAKIHEATEGTLSFLAHPKYNSFLSNTKASAVLINREFDVKKSVKTTLIRVSNAYESFNSLLIDLAEIKQKKENGIHETAIIDPSAKIANNVYIGPYATVGSESKISSEVHIGPHCFVGSKVSIGRGTIIQPNVCLLDEIEIGENCIFKSGSVVGSDGFGFIQKDNKNIKTPHIGSVIIKNEVEIGANTTVDRATLGATIIHDRVKLDNLVQIAHNVEIGPGTVIAAQSGVAGSTKIGARCTIGGQVGIIGHLVLGDDIQIQGQTGVIKNIKDGSIIQGTPAMEFKSFYKSYALFKKFPDFENRLGKLEKK